MALALAAGAAAMGEGLMKILVVVDMQNDFIDGALGTNEAPLVVGAVRDKIGEYRKNGFPVIFTRDTHGEDYLQTQEGRNLPVAHCIKGAHGWQITSELDTAQDMIFDKPSFGSIELARHIAEHCAGAEEIVVVGLCTDICVISNALILKAALPETPVTVDSSCCAGVTPQSHKNALEAMKMCQVRVI
ncbi:MAG: cysteine hydrolase [Clostridiales bacterium]|jgi:nicotinamidase-related amidase|nr:cysteine hydrolase [Clostridiales bacterium]